MRTTFHRILPILAITVAAALIGGCNIFDFASDTEKSDIELAEEYIRDGKYDAAREVLADDVADSTNAHALYLDAKAQLHQAGVDIVEIVELIEGQDTDDDQELALLDIIDDLSDEEQTAWYQANRGVSSNLAKIFDEQTVGPFEPTDIALGYTVSNLMDGILGLRDTNQDGIIDDNDFSLDILFDDSQDAFAITGGTFEDNMGEPQTFTGLEVFLGDWFAAKSTGSTLEGGKAGYEPDDINRLILHVMNLLKNSKRSLYVLLEKNVSSFDPTEIDKYVDQIASLINYYWYDDGIDTDGDGEIDEETINGIDDDGDGLIDEDTGYHPADPTNVRNTQYYEIWLSWSN